MNRLDAGVTVQELGTFTAGREQQLRERPPWAGAMPGPHPPQAGHLSTLALASGSQHSHPQTGLCRGQARLRVPGSEHGPH